MNNQESIAIYAELLQLSNASKVYATSLDAMLFVNGNAKREGRELPYSESVIKYHQDKISANNGRIVELTLKLAE